MSLPIRKEAQEKLEEYVKNEYQLHHALMVATAMEGYAKILKQDPDLWYITGLLHDIDFDQYPDMHPGKSLEWFKEWDYPEELIHAVEAHAYGYNGFTTKPESKLASGLYACDEISGIFYAYRKMNPVGYGEMKLKSIKKKLKEPSFAAKIDRESIYQGCEYLGISIDEHVDNLINFFSVLP